MPLRFKLKHTLVFVAMLAIAFHIVELQTRKWRERQIIIREITSHGGSDISFDDLNNVTWIVIEDDIYSSAMFQRINKVEHLYCSGSNVNDDSLVRLASLSKVMMLHLNNTQVTDAGLTHLKSIDEITALSLADTYITDESIDTLASLNILKGIDLSRTQVTKHGVGKLRAKCTHLDVVY